MTSGLPEEEVLGLDSETELPLRLLALLGGRGLGSPPADMATSDGASTDSSTSIAAGGATGLPERHASRPPAAGAASAGGAACAEGSGGTGLGLGGRGDACGEDGAGAGADAGRAAAGSTPAGACSASGAGASAAVVAVESEAALQWRSSSTAATHWDLGL